MQSTITVGDTLDDTITLADYPASEWVLKLRMAPRGAGTPISITCTASGLAHRVQADAATTAAWTPGPYAVVGWVEQGSTKVTVLNDSVTLAPDPRTLAAGADSRSVAEKALDDAKAALAAWTPTVRRFAIAGREQEFTSAGEIVAIISFWQTEVSREQSAKRMAAGLATRRQTLVRLARA